MPSEKKYSTFKSFYNYYLTEHADATNRALHFVGTFLLIGIIVVSFIFKNWLLLIFIPVIGYGFAWVGHFFIEKNKPATFTYPFYSLAGDFVMFWHMLTGQIAAKIKSAKENI